MLILVSAIRYYCRTDIRNTRKGHESVSTQLCLPILIRRGLDVLMRKGNSRLNYKTVSLLRLEKAQL